jgi:hypothetical protein
VNRTRQGLKQNSLNRRHDGSSTARYQHNVVSQLVSPPVRRISGAFLPSALANFRPPPTHVTRPTDHSEPQCRPTAQSDLGRYRLRSAPASLQPAPPTSQTKLCRRVRHGLSERSADGATHLSPFSAPHCCFRVGSCTGSPRKPEDRSNSDRDSAAREGAAASGIQ